MQRALESRVCVKVTYHIHAWFYLCIDLCRRSHHRRRVPPCTQGLAHPRKDLTTQKISFHSYAKYVCGVLTFEVCARADLLPGLSAPDVGLYLNDLAFLLLSEDSVLIVSPWSWLLLLSRMLLSLPRLHIHSQLIFVPFTSATALISHN